MINKRKLREIAKDSKKTAPYQSRADVRRQNDVNQIVARVAQGLGDASISMRETDIDRLIDEYYQPEEIPNPDALTEMLGDADVAQKVPVITGAALVIIIALYLALR